MQSQSNFVSDCGHIPRLTNQRKLRWGAAFDLFAQRVENYGRVSKFEASIYFHALFVQYTYTIYRPFAASGRWSLIIASFFVVEMIIQFFGEKKFKRFSSCYSRKSI